MNTHPILSTRPALCLLALLLLGFTGSVAENSPKTHSSCIVPGNTTHGKNIKVYETFDKAPTFPGGDSALMLFIANNIKFSPLMAESCVQGSVIVRFIVFSDGSTGNFEIIRSLDPAYDKEAKRVLSLMPRWQPGLINQQAVNCYYSLPVRFRLE